jgi:archaemetzincin
LGRVQSERVLGVTDVDLFVPVLRFVFGEAQLAGVAALVSVHRLRQEFYGELPDADLAAERLLKEALHELGHTFGLKHCGDWDCVMSASHSIERVDVRSAWYCPNCRPALPFNS